MFELTGVCTDRGKAIEFFEMLPDSIPDGIKTEEFCEQYEAALNTFRWCAGRLEETAPKFNKGKKSSAYDLYTCGGCGRILEKIPGVDKFCPECGRLIDWHSSATDVKLEADHE